MSTLPTPPRISAPGLTMDVYLGLDVALGYHDRAIAEAIANGADPETDSMKDLLQCLHAAQAWLMTVDPELQ